MADASSVLQQLRQRNPEITTAVLASHDGLAVHSETAGVAGPDADALAAMGADLVGRASQMSYDVNQGEARQVLVQSDGGYVVVSRISDDYCLVVAAKREATLGLLLVSVRKAAGEISVDVD